MEILILFAIIIVPIVLCFLFNKLLHFVSLRFGFIYWPITFAFTLLFFFMTIPGGPISINILGPNQSLDERVAEFAGAVGVIQFLHAYFLIPMMDGETGAYYSYTIETHVFAPDEIVEHEHETYTPGWWRKLLAQLGIGLICFFLCWLSSFGLHWLILVLELLYTGYLSAIAIIRKISMSRA